ncbi:MAG: T9SS type A sorting domain-containing protein [Bacteroidota bacterium]
MGITLFGKHIITFLTQYLCKLLAGILLFLVIATTDLSAQWGQDLFIQGSLFIEPGAGLFIQGNVSIETADGELSHMGVMEMEGNLSKDSNSKFISSLNSLIVFRNDSYNSSNVQWIEGDFTGTNAFGRLEIDNHSAEPGLHLATHDIEIRQQVDFKVGNLVTVPPPGEGFTPVFNKLIVSRNEPGTFTGDLINNFIEGRLRQNIRDNRTYYLPIGPIASNIGSQPLELTYYSGPNTYLELEFTEGAFTTPGVTATCDVGSPPGNIGTPDGITDQVMIDCVAGGKWEVTTNATNVLYDINLFPSPTLLAQCNSALHWLAKDSNLLSNCPITGYSAEGLTSFSFFDIPSVVDPSSSVILPIELIEFTAKGLNDYIELNWLTASEVNSDGFEIEKSLDGSTFERIGWVAAQGNTSLLSSYAFQDINVQKNKVYYYRLKMIDLDGHFEYSEVRTALLEASNQVTDARVYPNPINPDTHRLNYTALLSGDITISLFNALGAEVFTRFDHVTEGFNTLELQGVSSGVYHIVLQDEVYTRRGTVVVSY